MSGVSKLWPTDHIWPTGALIRSANLKNPNVTDVMNHMLWAVKVLSTG